MLKPLKIKLTLLSLFFMFFSCDPFITPDTFASISYEYPSSMRDTSHSDQYYGMEVRDPYQWMENPSSNLTRQWIQSQRELSSNYLGQIGFRSQIANRLQQLWAYEKAGSPFPLGDGMAQFVQTDFSRQPILYRLEEDNTRGNALFDPNQHIEYRDAVFSNWSFSRDGRYGAVVVEEAGGQLQTIIVIDLSSGATLADEILGVKDSRIAWHDKGFYYSKYEELEMAGTGLEADYFHQVYYHELGSSVTNDELIFADRSAPMQRVWPSISQDGTYLILYLKGTDIGGKIYIKNLRQRNSSFENLINSDNADYLVIGRQRSQMLLLTNDQAPNGELVRMRINRSGNVQREVVLPESEAVMQMVAFDGSTLLAVYNNEGASSISISNANGNNKIDVQLPQPGSVSDLVLDEKRKQACFVFSSFLRPPTNYRVNLETGALSTLLSPYTAFNTNEYQVRKVRFRSFDGESIPMYLLHKRGLEININTPGLLISVGGEDQNLEAQYNLGSLQIIPAFLESGGVVAVPLIRGTDRMGAFWYELGIQEKRQKALDDFQAAAAYLIDQEYSSAEKLAVYGSGPIGGFMATACLVQRPDLFKVVVAKDGIYDLLKFHQFTTGWKYASELGFTENQNDFDPLWAIDPRRNAISTNYPSVLLVASTTDNEIVPLHTYKLTAEMQARQQATNPIMMRLGNDFVNTEMRPNLSSVQEGADILSFIYYQLKHEPFQADSPLQ